MGAVDEGEQTKTDKIRLFIVLYFIGWLMIGGSNKRVSDVGYLLSALRMWRFGEIGVFFRFIIYEDENYSK